MAFWPPSVIHAALSGPWITPCGPDPEPRAISSARPAFGSNQPRWPLACAVNQTPPSGAGARSWMPVRRGVPSGQDCSLPDWARAGVAAPKGKLAAANAPITARRFIRAMAYLPVSGSAPNLLGRLDHQSQFIALCFHCDLVAVHGARKAALRRQRQLLDRRVLRGLGDAALECVLVFQLPEFRGDQTQHGGLALGQETQRAEVAGALVVVLHEV